VLLLMTGFTRIVIVLSLLRQALGTQAAPPNQVIIGLSLFLTFFVMGPTLDKVYEEAYKPYAANQIAFDEALARRGADARVHAQADAPGRRACCSPSWPSCRRREAAEQCRCGAGAGLRDQRAEERVPDRLHDLHPVPDHRHGGGQRADEPGHDDAQPGAGGLPFKLMLFVLADGWNLLLGSLAASLRHLNPF
jgi:flagellar biosynthetic protein FliP